VACALCDDTGWKSIEVDGVQRVTRCDCVRATAGERLFAETLIPKRYQHCTFANYLAYNETLKKAFDYCTRLAERFPVVERGVFLHGPPGVGKTHLAVAVLSAVTRGRGARGIYYDTRELLRVIRNTYDPVSRTAEKDVLGPVMRADVLVLDDLGAEKTSEWVEETLNLIVNTRYNEKRITILTSNYDDNTDITDPDSLLVRIGFRMHSRLHEMCEFLYLDGGDYRHLPVNGGVDDLLTLWKTRNQATRKPSRESRLGGQSRGSLPDRTSGQLRMPSAKSVARGKDGKGDLKWAGGKAGN
jgi:DNA replication protein DnaC